MRRQTAFVAQIRQTTPRLLSFWTYRGALFFAYTTIFAILDFYEHLGEVKHFSNSEFKVADALWNTAKAKYCAENGIDFHIDDSKAYAKWFITPYCLYKGKEQECYVKDNQKIDFSGHAIEALDEIENIIRSQR